MDEPCANYHAFNRSIAENAKLAGRQASTIELLAVSKRQSAAAVRTLAGCGQLAFGENYLQEAQQKIHELADLALTWHFIGPLQSNKAQEVARLFDWVHSVDREKIARKLNDGRPTNFAPLNVCIQVNISGEESKNGIAPADLAEFARIFQELPQLKLRGLMALPAPETSFDKQRVAFRELRERYTDVFGPNIDTLSMGTSQDYKAAIMEGATMIRIGTALFGPRN